MYCSSGKHQTVDIDEYFEGFEDTAEPLGIPPSWPTTHALTALSFKAILMDKPTDDRPVLVPYQRQGSTLRAAKSFSAFELASAQQAVISIKQQLMAEPKHTAQPTLAQALRWATPTHLSRAGVVSVVILGTTLVAMATYPGSGRNGLPVQALGSASLGVMGSLPTPTSPETAPTADQVAFQRAIEQGQTAAELTQSATTEADWQAVISLWQQAINELQPILPDSPLFSQAQARYQSYQTNVAYAQAKLEVTPLQSAVDAAETASQLAANAITQDDWAEVAIKWREALSSMEAIPTSSPHYEVAQAKMAEYATKFAYSQNRYLRLQSIGAL